MFPLGKFILLVTLFAVFGFSYQKSAVTSNDDLKCGITYHETKSGHHRVNHGDTASEGQWPWMAALILNIGHKSPKMYSDKICSATIISEEYILSAGHCIKDFAPEIQQNYTKMVQVAVGAVNVVTGHPTLVDIAAAFPHPSYNKSSFQNDLLVLKLAKPLVLSDKVQPICLAGSFDGDNVTKPEDESALVAGWGYKDHNGTETDTLLYGHMYFVDIETCARNHTGWEIKKDMHICAAGKRQNTEGGDSGGPIFVKSDLTDEAGRHRYVEVGICSFEWYPDVFARVSSHCDFIEEITNGTVKCVNL